MDKNPSHLTSHLDVAVEALRAYLLDHGMVDMVVHRRDLPETLARLGRLLTKQPAVKEEAPARPVAEAV